MDGAYEASSVARGLDFLQPYESASNSWRMDVKAQYYNVTLSQTIQPLQRALTMDR
jgi:hypothetical protein